MQKLFHLAFKKKQKIYEHLGERRNTKIIEMWKKIMKSVQYTDGNKYNFI